MIETLKEKYSSVKSVLNYLKDLQKDIIDNVSLFMKPAEAAAEQGQPGAGAGQAPGQPPYSMTQNQTPAHLKILSTAMRRYSVNVIVKHKKDEGAPIVFLDNPTLPNLVGRMERLQQSGSVIMDFNLLKPGALHEANGGFLIIDAKHILSHPPAWEALKRALRSKKIAIEAQDDDNNVITTIMLDPEPIDLNLKVILMGDSDLTPTIWIADEIVRGAEHRLFKKEHVIGIAPFDDNGEAIIPPNATLTLLQKLTLPGGIFPSSPIAFFGFEPIRKKAENELISKIPDWQRINLIGSLGLLSIEGCIEKCRFFIGGDSVISHMAAVANIASLIIEDTEAVEVKPKGRYISVIPKEQPLDEIIKAIDDLWHGRLKQK